MKRSLPEQKKLVQLNSLIPPGINRTYLQFSKPTVPIKATLMFTLIMLFAGSFIVNGQTVVKEFSQRTSQFSPNTKIYSLKGDFTIIGNTNMIRDGYVDGGKYWDDGEWQLWDKAPNNGDMVFVDVDSDSGTSNSSSATLELYENAQDGVDPSCSKIVFAGLYWTGRETDNSLTFSVNGKTYDKRSVKLKGPGASNYTTVTANNSNIYYPINSETGEHMFVGYAEVTDYVKTYGLGSYSVADIALKEGSGGIGLYGGWGLVVIYENSNMKWRDITIFDGYAYMPGSVDAYKDLAISGFNTVQNGDVNLRLGIMAGEGDRDDARTDYLQIQKLNSNTWETLSHAGNVTNNFLNSSIETGDNARNPNYSNNFGLDISTFYIDNTNNSIIANGQTATTFRYGSWEDAYIIFFIAMAVDSYTPEPEAINIVTYIDGSAVASGSTPEVLPGQEIDYELEIRNIGSEDIDNGVITIPIPYTADFISSTGTYYQGLSGPQPYYDPNAGATGSIIWEIGELPEYGPEVLLGKLTFKLKATTDCFILSNTNCSPAITIDGSISGVGAESGIAFDDVGFIQGYEMSGSCEGDAISEPLSILIDGADYVTNNCDGDYSTREFTYCNVEETAIPFADVKGYFPAGTQFYDEYPPVAGSTEFTSASGFPKTNGTTTYYAVPPGITDCYWEFTITVDEITSTPVVPVDLAYCVGEEADPLTATASDTSYTLYFYTSETDDTPETSIIPSTDTAGTLSFWVAEGISNQCISPNKEEIIVTINSLPDPVISGQEDACLNSTVMYSTDSVIGNTYQWSVTNGTIIGSSTSSSVNVTWSTIGVGSVSVEETTSEGCSQTDALTIEINEINITVENCPDDITFCADTIFQDTLGKFVTWNDPTFGLSCIGSGGANFSMEFELPESWLAKDCWIFDYVQRVGGAGGHLKLFKSTDVGKDKEANTYTPYLRIGESTDISIDLIHIGDDFRCDMYLVSSSGSETYIGGEDITASKTLTINSGSTPAGTYRVRFKFTFTGTKAPGEGTKADNIRLNGILHDDACGGGIDFITIGPEPGFFAVGDTTLVYTAIYTPNSGDPVYKYCSFDLRVNPLPSATISSSSPVCKGDDAIFNLEGEAGNIVTYNIDGGADQNKTLDINGKGIVKVDNALTDVTLNLLHVTNGTCVIDLSESETISYIVCCTETITAGSDIEVCMDETINLSSDFSDGTNYNSINWTGPNGFTSSSEDTSFTASTVDLSGEYIVTVNYGFGCVDKDTVVVTVNELPSVTLTLSKNEACVDAATFALAGGAPSGGTYSGTGVSGGNFDPATAGIGKYEITYTYTDGNGCIDSATDSITVNELPICSISGESTNICPESARNFSAPAAMGTYKWSVEGNAAIDGDSTLSSVSIISGDLCDSTYTVFLSITSIDGCSSKCEKTILVAQNDSVELVVPGDTIVSACISTQELQTIVTNWQNNIVKVNGGCNAKLEAPQSTGFEQKEMYCGGELTIIWSASSDCEGLVSDSTIITITPSDPLVLTAPNDTILEACPDQAELGNIIQEWQANGLSLSGACYTDMIQMNPVEIVEFSSAISMDQINAYFKALYCGGEFTLVWSATDICTNELLTDTAKIILGTTDPLVMDVPKDTVFDACTDITIINTLAQEWLTTPVSLSGACYANQMPSPLPQTQGAIDACGGKVTFVWTAQDFCTDSILIDSASIILDNTPAPVIMQSASNDTTACTMLGDIEKSASITSTDPYLSWLSRHGDMTVSDSCGSQILWSDNSDTANWTGNGCEKSIEIIFTATNLCGLSISDTAQFFVIDTLAPELTGILPDKDYGNLCLNEIPSAPKASYISSLFTDNCNTVTASMVDSSIVGTNCNWTATYKYIAEDICGNKSDTVKVVYTGGDNEAPTWKTGDNELNATIQCSDTTALDSLMALFPVAEDNCDSDVSNIVLDTSYYAAGTCPDAGKHYQKWTVTDTCGNTSDVFTQVITVEDTQAPTQIAGTTLPQGESNLNLCADEMPAGPSKDSIASLFEDNCGMVHVDSTRRVYYDDNCRWEVAYIYDVYDDCDNYKYQAVVVKYSGRDTEAPQLDSSLTIPGGVSDICFTSSHQIEAQLMPSITTIKNLFTDNCDDNLEIIPISQKVTGNKCDWTADFKFVVLDECDNDETITISYWGGDTIPPSITDTATNLTVDCSDYNNELQGWLANHGGASATDNCPGDGPDRGLTWTNNYHDSMLVNICGATDSAQVIFTVTDDCGYTASDTAVLRIEDNTPPELVGSLPQGDTDMNLCFGNIPAGPTAAEIAALYQDACDTVLVKKSGTPTGNDCQWSVTYVYAIKDRCDNEADSVKITYSGGDTELPIVTAPQGGDLGCNPADSVYAALDTLIWEDNCDNNVMSGVIPGTPSDMGDCIWSVTHKYWGVDNCGNNDTVTQTYTWTYAPEMVITAPADTTITACPDQQAIFGMFNNWLKGVTNNGGCNTDVDHNAHGMDGFNTCGDSIMVIWTGESSCLDDVYDTAYFIIDPAPEVIVTAPKDTVVEACNSQDSINAMFTAWLKGSTVEGGCGTEDWNNADLMPDSCGDIVTVVWYAADICGDSTITDTATFTVNSGPAPVFTVQAQDMIVDCSGDFFNNDQERLEKSAQVSNPLDLWLNSYGNAVAVNGCGDLITNENNWSYRYLINDGYEPDCPIIDSIAVEFTVTDNCGRSSSDTAVFISQDTTPPVLSPVPGDTIIDCSAADLAVATLTAIDSCMGEFPVDYKQDTIPGDCPSNYILLRKWFATDYCGNSDTVTQRITVVDTTPPTIGCPEDVFVNIDADVPDSLLTIPLPKVEDNCSEYTFWNDYNGTANASDVYKIGVTEVTYFAMDDCGNIDSCTFNVTVLCEDQTRIEGTVYDTLTGAPLPNVRISLIHDINDTTEVQIAMKVTDSNGHYYFTNMEPGSYHLQVHDANLNVRGYYPTGSSLWFGDIVECKFDTANFGYEYSELLTLGDLVWYDLNGNDIQDEWYDANDDDKVTQNFPDASGAIDPNMWEWFDANNDGKYTGPENEGELNKAGVYSGIRENNIIIEGPNGYYEEVIVGIEGRWRSREPVVDSLLGDYTVSLYNGPYLQEYTQQMGDTGLVKVLLATTKSALIDAEEDLLEDGLLNCGSTSGPKTTTLSAENPINLDMDFGVRCELDSLEVYDWIVECDGQGNLDEWGTFRSQFDIQDPDAEVSVVADTAYGCGLTKKVTVTAYVTIEPYGTDTISATFTIEDTTPPDIEKPATNPVVQCTPEGYQAALQAWIDNHGYAEANDDCGNISWRDNYDSDNFETICCSRGKVTVIFFADDECGNTSQTIGTFEVVDLEAPSFTVPADTIIFTDENCEYDASIEITGDVTDANDNCCTEVSVSYSDSILDGQCAGEWIILRTWTVQDDCENDSSAVQTITVHDSIAPFLSCNPVSVYLDETGGVTFSETDLAELYTVTDNCTSDEDITVEVSQNEFGCTNSGTQEGLVVVVTATDLCGNVATCSSSISVLDTIAPTAMCNDLTVALDATGNASITVDEIENGSTDNCSIDTMYIDKTDFDCGNVGENLVTLTVVDVAGNEGTCTAIVTVEEGDYDCGSVSLMANPDILTLIYCPGYGVTGDMNLFANDEGFIPENVTFSMLTTLPDGVSLTGGNLSYVDETAEEAVFNLIYSVCHNVNTENCDTAAITIRVLLDTDCDGIHNGIDIDDDDDGILDIHEQDESKSVLANGDIDTDGDGVVDRLDIDSDDDGIVDNIEWQQNIPEGAYHEEQFNGSDLGFDYYPPLGRDSDGDGWDDQYDEDAEAVYYYPVFDMDNDGIPDHQDPDADNDEIPDYIEGWDAFDHDTIPDTEYIGTDSDGDGLDDAYDTYDTSNEWLHGKNAIGSGAPLQDMAADTANNIRDWRDVIEPPEKVDSTQAEGCELVIPDGFSPNEDGYNDLFKIIFECAEGEQDFEDVYPNAKIEIFNRWGNLIFEQENFGNESRRGLIDAWWNGTSIHEMQIGKSKLPAANYFYILYFNEGDKKPVTGFIFLNN